MKKNVLENCDKLMLALPKELAKFNLLNPKVGVGGLLTFKWAELFLVLQTFIVSLIHSEENAFLENYRPNANFFKLSNLVCLSD